MKTPGFWYRPPGLAAWALAPLGALYGLGGRLRRRRAVPQNAGVPVVCVGNLVAGGAGKTPVCLALAGTLAAMGHRVHFLTRGHGGRERGPLAVDPARHTAADVGDEALLLAASAPAWVARDRVAGARAAAQAGATVVVMDDGFQNPHLAHDLALVVADGAVGFGNGFLVPAGPLREPVAEGLARAGAVVLAGEDRAGVTAQTGALPVLRVDLVPEGAGGEWRGRRVLAFAGIGRPEKFFDTLRAVGAVVVERVPFPDHHPYTPDTAMDLVERAARLNARPATTAKDAVRLPPEARAMVDVLPVRAVWQDGDAVRRLLPAVL